MLLNVLLNMKTGQVPKYRSIHKCAWYRVTAAITRTYAIADRVACTTLFRTPANGFSVGPDPHLSHRLRWYGHVLREEDNDWVKKCMEYEV